VASGPDAHPIEAEEEAMRVGISLGLTLIDTAEAYGGGRAEEMIGRVITGQRDHVFIVSKVVPSHADPAGIRRACEGSLGRLGTDHLDLYLLHWRDGIRDLSPVVSTFEELKAAGRIRRPRVPHAARRAASANTRGTESLRTLRWREMDSNHRFPVRIKHKDGTRRRRSAYPAHSRHRMHWQKGDSNSAPPLESIPALNCFGTSGFDRAANGRCRSCSSGLCVEVRLFLENRTIVAANRLVRSQADHAASSLVHSASLVQPARIRYWASSADISMVPSGLTLMCRPEKVCTDPRPEGACRRTRYRSGFSGF
jgi:hypothetical protein